MPQTLSGLFLVCAVIIGKLIPKTKLYVCNLVWLECMGSETNIKKKTRKHDFHGIVPGLLGRFC